MTDSRAPDTRPTDEPLSTRSAVESAPWADSITIDFESTTFRFRGDGVPNHDRAARYAVPNEGVSVPTGANDSHVVDDPTKPQNYDFELSLIPVYSDTITDVPVGPVGMIVSGAPVYNPYEADGTTVGMDSNFEIDGVAFVDACTGHPVPFNNLNQYHYHGVPTCITDKLDRNGEHSVLIGIAFDGFPIYGPQDVGGSTPTDLDECQGHLGPTPEFPHGIYHYHLMHTEPYSMPCLHGEVELSPILRGIFGGVAAN